MKTIRDWQSELNIIYPNSNMSADYMMAHLYTGCAEVGRLLLRGERDIRIDQAIIGSMGWVFALANHFDVNFEKAAVSNFPSKCRYCLGRPCHCDVSGKRAKRAGGGILSDHERRFEIEYSSNAIINSGTKITFAWIIDQLSSIYPSNRALINKGGQSYIVGKLLEEGGELHRAYSDLLLGGKNKDGIGEELADVSAWILSCWDLNTTGQSLDSEFASAFSSGCHACTRKPCICKPYSITKSQEDLLKEISSQLRALTHVVGDRSDIEEIIELAEDAVANPTSAKKASLSDRLKTGLSILKSTAEGSAAAGKIVDNVVEIAGKITDFA